MRVVDIFCGAGGFSKGFAQAGFEISAAYDNEPAAMALHARNLPTPVRKGLRIQTSWANAQRRGGRHRLADLTDLLRIAPDIADLEPDVVVGGPPCQAFSAAGKRGGDEDPRALLTEAYAVVVCASRPAYFVMENVAGARKSRVYARAMRMFRRAGYGLTEQVIDMSLYGVGQRRERLIVMGALGEQDGWAAAYLESAKSARPTTVRDVLGDAIGDAYFRIGHRQEERVSFRSVDEPAVATTTTADRRRSGPDGYTVRRSDERFLDREGLFFMYPGGSSSAGTRSVDAPLPTITRRAWDAPGPTYKPRTGDVLDVHSLPVLSFDQLAALSGFPADWVWQPDDSKPLSKAARMLALANAVPPPAAERIARIILAHHRRQPPAATLPVSMEPGFARWLSVNGVARENVRQRMAEARSAMRILNGRSIRSCEVAERVLGERPEFQALGRSRRSNLLVGLRLYYRFLDSLSPVFPEGIGEDMYERTEFPASFARLRERRQPPLPIAAE